MNFTYNYDGRDIYVQLYAHTQLYGYHGYSDQFVCWEVDYIDGDFNKKEKEEILHYLRNDGYKELIEFAEMHLI